MGQTQTDNEDAENGRTDQDEVGELHIANVRVDPLAPAADVYLEQADTPEVNPALHRVSINLRAMHVTGCTCKRSGESDDADKCGHEQHISNHIACILSLRDDGIGKSVIANQLGVSEDELRRLERFIDLD